MTVNSFIFSAIYVQSDNKVPSPLFFVQFIFKGVFNDEMHCTDTYSDLCSNLNYWKLPEVKDEGGNLKISYDKLVTRRVK